MFRIEYYRRGTPGLVTTDLCHRHAQALRLRVEQGQALALTWRRLAPRPAEICEACACDADIAAELEQHHA